MNALIVDTQHLWYESKNAGKDRVDYAKVKAHFKCEYNFASVKLTTTTQKFAELLMANGWSVATPAQFTQLVNQDATAGKARKIKQIYAAMSAGSIRQLRTEIPPDINIQQISIGFQAGAIDISQLDVFQVWGA